ncbi:MAG: methanogenesis marker 3 protein [Methanotrichaceae archaeon]|nr:methanogenesis marker 3 protein [Methanotrichaceae archaeon]
MKVLVDEKELELQEGATLGDALKEAGAVLAKGAIAGIVKGRSEKERETDSYWLNTTKGKLRIELLGSGLQQIWHESVAKIGDSDVRWSSPDGVAFGSFSSSLPSSRAAGEYNRWQILLGAAGFESEKTQLIFVRRRHTAVYGAPSDGGVFARVVGGKNVLDLLDKGDRILGVEPIVEWEELTEKLAVEDPSTPLAEGMEIFTRLDVELEEDAPTGAEFFLALTRDGSFKVDASSSSYISSDMLLGERISFEHREPRLEGTVTIRTAGRGLGRAFVYKGDRTSNPSHSVVARIKTGMDLVKLAEPGQLLTVKVTPERIMLMGSRLDQAQALLKERGIDCRVEGYSGEDAVVVEQDPDTTMGILKAQSVTLSAIPASRLVRIELYYDRAPKSLDYFRHVTGLKERPVGPLPVYFVYENTLLFRPVIQAVSYKELLPENKPTGPVPAGSIGISNQVAKKIGLVGVRLVEDKRYGPSGEKFEATNIVGRVLEPEKLKDVKEGETVYVLEVR